jgi:uncharacterized membrane protein YbhN (UPF0104 family)
MRGRAPATADQVAPVSGTFDPSTVEPKKWNRRMRTRPLWMVLRVGAAIVLLVVLARALGRNELARGMAIVRDAGWPLALVLLGTPLALGFDSLGWRTILRNLGSRVPWLRLIRIRIISETLVLALPGGGLMAEAAKLALLGRRGGVPPSTAIASLALARTLHLGGASAYAALVAVLLFTLPKTPAPDPRSRLMVLAFGASLVMALASRILVSLLRDARLAAHLARRLERIPVRTLSNFVAKHRDRLDEIDGHTARYFQAPAIARVAASLPFVFQWLVEGAETAFVLTLLHADVGLRGALVVDAMTSFARAVIVIVPAGVGVQEAAQVFLLHALGARDSVATAAALIFIKRTKELFWIVTGGILATATRESWQATPSPPS